MNSRMMKHGLTMIGVMLALAMTPAFAQDAYRTQGNWQGDINGSDHVLRAQVVALGGDDYRAVFFLDTTFPENERLNAAGKASQGVVSFNGDGDLGVMGAAAVKGAIKFSGQGRDRVGEFTGTLSAGGKDLAFSMKKVFVKSPTLGAEPPAGAMVLLAPGKPQLVDQNWDRQPRWGYNDDDGSVYSTGSNFVTKAEYGSGKYHVEFSTPFQPYDRGQERGNSGFYVEGRYEIQVLDSYGDAPADNLCGGIYQQAVPRISAVLPPGEWQTYDVTFHAPEFDANGQKTKNAVITVVHNGETIFDNLELKHPTPGGLDGKEAPTGRFFFQDHTDNGLRYRNVWFVPID